MVQCKRLDVAVLQSVPKVEVLRKVLYEAALGPWALDVVWGRFQPVGTVRLSSSRDGEFCDYQMQELLFGRGMW